MRLSDHFTEHERACPCCGWRRENKTLVSALEALRGLCGDVPIHVTSWCRCQRWNDTVGGTLTSKHTFGQAADIIVQGMEPVEVAAQAEKVPAFSHGGIGIYDNFVHVDVRTDGPARW